MKQAAAPGDARLVHNRPAAWLRVYLGYAPGVGKTYAMLDEGRCRRDRGTDVVVGWVQTYDRPYTVAAVGGLEIVPSRPVEYRGQVLHEMDVEAVIARRPQVALVDELAHSNVPGSKHLKRYQDVLDLREYGINVISTVNIQHLASLHETVQVLAGVTVTETLPDWVLEAADELEIVDCQPEALRKRLRRGHVQPKGQVERALEMLPSSQRRAEPDPATAALATVELTDDVADYHAQTLPQRLSAPASMAVIFLVTAALQWPAAVILLAATLLVAPNMRLAGLFAKEGASARLAASTRLGAVVLDSFRGMHTLRSIGALERRRNELAQAAASLNVTTIAVVQRAFLSGAVMDVVITFSIAANATYVGLSLLGYIRIGTAPSVTLFNGLLVLLLCPMYFHPIRAMAAAYHSQERALAAVPTTMALLAEVEAVPRTGARSALLPAGPVTVVLDNVSFRFPNANQPVWHGVDMVLRPGCWTAIVGPSGVGKTTLLSLIAGVRQPTAGTVRWVVPAGVRPPHLGGCAWIGQQTVLLPGSISDNIRIGRPTAARPRWSTRWPRPGCATSSHGCQTDWTRCSTSRPLTSIQTPRRM